MRGARIRGLTGNGELEHFVYNQTSGRWERRPENFNQRRNRQARPSVQVTHQNPQNNDNPPTGHEIPVVGPSNIHNNYHNIDLQIPKVENKDVAMLGAPDHPPPDSYENDRKVHPHYPQYPSHFKGHPGASGSGSKN